MLKLKIPNISSKRPNLKLKLPHIPWKKPFDAITKKAEKIKRPHRLLIFFGVIAFLGGGFTYLIYIPKAEAISQKETEIAALEDKIRIGKIRAKSLPALKAKKAEIDEKLLAALELLPDAREIPSLLKGITEQGIEAGLEFKLFVPELEAEKDFYVEIPVNIEVEGNYRNVADFFYKVSKMKRIVNIINVSMRPKENLSETLITRCNAITYRFKEKEEKPKPAEQKK